MSRHALVVRLDSLGDMVICGPALRAVAAGADRVSVLAGPAGAAAARLLPGVDDVLVWECPWIVAAPPPVDPVAMSDVVARIAALGADDALVLTSFHQSALPTALLLRLAGLPRIAAASTDYAGALLDVRLAEPADGPEPRRMLALAAGAGYRLPAGDDGRLAVVAGLPPPSGLPEEPFVVVHPGVSAPARAYPVDHFAAVVAALSAAGRTVVVTGSGAETALTAQVAAAAKGPGRVLDLGGALGLPELAATLRRADVVVAANTGPAHLAAAVGTAVVSLFAPVVPASRWAPFATRRIVLGDQDAACRGSRARTCPVPEHPCLSGVSPAQVVLAVEQLSPRSRPAATRSPAAVLA